jgi:plastocyanin
MRPARFAHVPAWFVTTLLAAACGGGGGDNATVTAPPVAASVTVSGATGSLGAIGRTRQYGAVVATASGAPIPGATVSWNSSNAAVATINASGLATVTGNGTTTITASSGGITSAGVTLTAQQVVAAVTVASPSGLVDSLPTSGLTRQFTATARDSLNNAIGGPTFAWSSSNSAVASVNATTGLVTIGTTVGSATISATTGGITGSQGIAAALVVTSIAFTPTSATITTNAGTQPVSVVMKDAANATVIPGALTIFWTSRNTAVATVATNPPTGATLTAAGNGSTFLVVQFGTKRDSIPVTVSGQGASAPNAVAVNVGDFFFTSVRNGTSNTAVDTVAVGGTVTWTWGGSFSHNVQSTGAPSFTSSPTKAGSGTYQFTFPSAGTFQYNCVVHGSAMTGTIVVR